MNENVHISNLHFHVNNFNIQFIFNMWKQNESHETKLNLLLHVRIPLWHRFDIFTCDQAFVRYNKYEFSPVNDVCLCAVWCFHSDVAA